MANLKSICLDESNSTPDWQGMEEARIVGAGQPWLKQVWQDDHWHLYELSDPEPLASPPNLISLGTFANPSFARRPAMTA